MFLSEMCRLTLEMQMFILETCRLTLEMQMFILNPFIFIKKNGPLLSLTVPTNLKHEKFAAGI